MVRVERPGCGVDKRRNGYFRRASQSDGNRRPGTQVTRLETKIEQLKNIRGCHQGTRVLREPRDGRDVDLHGADDQARIVGQGDA